MSNPLDRQRRDLYPFKVLQDTEKAKKNVMGSWLWFVAVTPQKTQDVFPIRYFKTRAQARRWVNTVLDALDRVV